MSDLVVIAYPDEKTADRAMADAESLKRRHVLEYEQVFAVVREKDGKVSMHAPGGILASGGAKGGAVWGAIFGMLFLIPVIGAVTGGIFGAIMSAMNKSGIDQQFRDKVQEQVRPGTSAIVLVFATPVAEKDLEALVSRGGTVLQTTLSEEAERELQDALQGQNKEQPAA